MSCERTNRQERMRNGSEMRIRTVTESLRQACVPGWGYIVEVGRHGPETKQGERFVVLNVFRWDRDQVRQRCGTIHVSAVERWWSRGRLTHAGFLASADRHSGAACTALPSMVPRSSALPNNTSCSLRCWSGNGSGPPLCLDGNTR